MKKRKYYVIYTILFVVVFLIGFSPVLVERRSLVGHDDAFNEYYCAFVYLGRWIRSAFSGDFHLYDTSIALGESVIGALNYYGFGDILLIPFSLFPEKYIHYGYTLSIVSRLYLAGAAFLLYCDRKGYRTIYSIIAALFYVFSPYTLVEGMLFHCYVTVLVWLPLIMTGVEKVFKASKHGNIKEMFSTLLVVAVFCLSLTGFYFLYMVIIYVAVWMIIELLFQRDKYQIRSFIMVMSQFALGMGMAGFILLPAVKYFLASPRSGKTSYLSAFLQLPTKETIINALNNLITPPEHIYDYLAFTLPVVFLLIFICLFRIKHTEMRPKLILGTIISFYGYFFPAIGIMMNGFERHYDRWIFLAEFFFAGLFVYVAPKMLKNVSVIDEILVLLFSIVWCIFTLKTNEIKINDYPIIAFYCFLLTLLLIIIDIEKKHNLSTSSLKLITNVLCALCIVNICGNVFFMNASGAIGGSESKEFFRANVRGEYTETPIYWNSQLISNRVFERYDIINEYMRDQPLICGLNTTYGSYSINNGSIWDLKGKLNMHYPLHGLDARQVLESLLCVSNYSTEGWGSWETVDNEYYLPLGIVFDGYTTEDIVENLSPLEKQNSLFSTVILQSGDKYNGTRKEPDVGEVEEIPISLNFIGCKLSENNELSADSESKIEVVFEPDASIDGKTTELYLSWEDSYSPTYVGVNVATTSFALNNSNNYLVCLDYIKDKGVIDITFNRSVEISLGSIKLYKSSVNGFVNKYNNYLAHSLSDAKWENDSYSGVTNEKDEGYLFMALPCIDGWECTVDGVKTEILRADYNFMAVYIPAGEHFVKFTYNTPWLIKGVAISIFCIAIFIMIIAKNYFRQKHNFS